MKELLNSSALFPKLMKQVKCTINPIKFICKTQFFSICSTMILLFKNGMCGTEYQEKEPSEGATGSVPDIPNACGM